MLNKLLQRQIHKHLGDTDNLPEHYKNLFQVISESYDHFEKDRKMLERSIDLSSTEMIALNNQLRNDIKILENAKKEIKENAANLNAIINNTDDSIFSIDKNYKILSANHTFLKNYTSLTGTTPIPGDHLFQAEISEERILAWKKYFDQALKGEPFKIEISDLLNGTPVYAEISFNPIREKEEVIGVGCFSRNVTQEKINAETIKASESRFRSLIENSQDMLSLMSAEGIIEYISPSIERAFGYTIEESKGTNALGLIHPDDLPILVEQLKQMLENPGIPIPFTIRNKRKEGDYLWVEGTLTNLLHIEGIKAIVGNFRDITEQKISKEKLQNSEANLQTIFNNSDTGYVLVDKGLKVIYFNQNAQQFVNDELHNALREGGHVYDFFPPERREVIKTVLLSVLQGKSINYEINYAQPDGKEKWYYARYFPVSNEEGVFSIILSITNVTERKLIEQKIKQSNDRYELATKATNDAIWDWNILTNELYWTEGFEKNFGYKNANVEKNIRTWIEHLHPDDRTRVTESVHAALHNPDVDFWQDEYRFLKEDGSVADIYDRGYIVYNDEKKPVRMVGAMQDITERKKAEKALQKSDGQLREISSSIPGIVYQYKLDTEGKQSFPYISEGVLTLFGIHPNDIYANPDKYFCNIHLDDLDAFIQSAMVSARTMEPWLHCFRVKTIDNSYKYIRGNSIPRMMEDGSILWNGTLIDITDSKEIEEKLKYAEHLLSEAQQLAKVGNWNLDLTKNEIFWSSGTKMIYGVDDDFVPGFSSFISMLHPEDRDRVVVDINTAKQTGKTVDHDFRIIRKDGQIRILKGQTRVEMNSEGFATRIFGISHDVTELKMAEETLRRSEANLRSIFDNTKTSYILLDTECRVQSFNPIAEQWAKDALSVVLKENDVWWNYFAAHLHKKLKATGKAVLQGSTVKEEVRFLQADNTVHYYDAIANPVFNHEGTVLGICIAFNDITERKLSEIERERMTSEIIQRNKNLEQFSYIVSHNLRAPVANIIGISTALQEDDSDESITEELQRGLHTSVLKLDEVILDLNNILQIKHKLTERKETVRFAKLSTDIYVSIQHQIQNSHARIKWDFSEVEEMLTLKSYMQSIFYNLIFNSVKYRQPNLAPVIEIKSRKRNNKIELLFRDNCMGIDLQKNGDQVFGLYKRFHNNEIQGKGIGLFMVKTQVEAIGGKISVNSEVNKGTEFKIEFDV